MTWNSTWPVGTVSVKANRLTGNQNTSYIESTMKIDHYWNESTAINGFHKQIEMPKLATEPTTLTALSDSNYYIFPKTAIESPDLQSPEPFILTQDSNNVFQYLQLGIRAMASWQLADPVGSPAQSDVKYTHNIKTQGGVTKGIVRESEGVYTLNFQNNMPTNNYIVTGSAWRDANAENNLVVGIYRGTARSDSMKKASVKISFVTVDGGNLRDPDFAMIQIVGG